MHRPSRRLKDTLPPSLRNATAVQQTLPPPLVLGLFWVRLLFSFPISVDSPKAWEWWATLHCCECFMLLLPTWKCCSIMSSVTCSSRSSFLFVGCLFILFCHSFCSYPHFISFEECFFSLGVSNLFFSFWFSSSQSRFPFLKNSNITVNAWRTMSPYRTVVF